MSSLNTFVHTPQINVLESWTACRRLLCLQSRSKSAPSAKLWGGSSGDRPLTTRAWYTALLLPV